MDTKKIASIIFPTNAGSSEAQDEERYTRICKWLSEPPKGYRLRRIFSLLMIRTTRELHLSAEHMWDLRIRELQHLLELEPMLPRQIRETFPNSMSSILAGLALTYLAQLECITDLTEQRSLALLTEAEKYNDLAVEAFRRQGKPAQIALHQRTGANICILKIMRIEQQLRRERGHITDVSDGMPDGAADGHVPRRQTEVEGEKRDLRDIGLEKVRESDAIYTETALHATWSVGVEGIT